MTIWGVPRPQFFFRRLLMCMYVRRLVPGVLEDYPLNEDERLAFSRVIWCQSIEGYLSKPTLQLKIHDFFNVVWRAGKRKGLKRQLLRTLRAVPDLTTLFQTWTSRAYYASKHLFHTVLFIVQIVHAIRHSKATNAFFLLRPPKKVPDVSAHCICASLRSSSEIPRRFLGTSSAKDVRCLAIPSRNASGYL